MRRLVLPAGILELAGLLEYAEIVRQRRRGTGRRLVTCESDRDPASARLLALTWWPAGIAALAAAACLPRLDLGQKWDRPCLIAGLAVTGAGIAVRQWAITTMGPYFTGHVLVQPGQTVVSSGPYRWVRHPSYTGQWLEMTGVGLAAGNVASMAICVLVPLIGITARITGEERELTASLPGYHDYAQGKPRLIPFPRRAAVLGLSGLSGQARVRVGCARGVISRDAATRGDPWSSCPFRWPLTERA